MQLIRQHRLLTLAIVFTCVLSGVVALLVAPNSAWAEDKSNKEAKITKAGSLVTVPPRPRVAGKFKLQLRSRRETEKDSGKFQTLVRDVEWNTAETAVIICDMWDNHYCQSAAQRVDEMAPRMNAVITAARNHGAMIIHSPSGTMQVYADTPYRQRMQAAPLTKAPIEIQGWCYLDPKSETQMPVDVSKTACDDPVIGAKVRRYSKQHAGIKMIGYDGVSDNGQEIYNVIHQEGIKNVVIMGVHTNMCVLGRPFGIRQLVRLGLNVALARDLTDAMYDPRQPPYVSHTRGTELVVEHIEKYWCPSFVGKDLTTIVPGTADPDASVAGKKAQANPVTSGER